MGLLPCWCIVAVGGNVVRIGSGLMKPVPPKEDNLVDRTQLITVIPITPEVMMLVVSIVEAPATGSWRDH